MASSGRQKRQKKQDQFDCLSDDILLLIINKLLTAKALIRLSLVSKRFFSLVFKAHSVSVNLYQRSSREHLPKTQNPCAILSRFQQMKHLYFRICAREPPEGDGSGFFGSVAVFRSQSHFEFCHLLIAESLNQSNPSVSAGVDAIHGLGDQSSESALKMLGSLYGMIRTIVLEYEMLESIVFSDDLIKLKVVMMGKEQIARLRTSTNGISNVRTLAYSVPTLRLGELGYTMKDVLFVRGIAENQNVEEVVMDVPFLNQSDFKDWQVFNGAVKVLMDKISTGENKIGKEVTVDINEVRD
ncbi:hypothetical protein PTKIN_Ptkin01aG0386800 [Pterospermum kingtungense]